jgi:bifunctional non-homologous end joining protein LigD
MIHVGVAIVLIFMNTDLWGVRYAMRKKQSALKEYHQRRQFKKTREPRGEVAKRTKNIFVVQKHNASHLHYDFRLAIDGVLKSWAVPKGPSKRVGLKRLAVQTEDHPLAYATFEGTIAKGNYGAGTVEIWDHGTYSNEKTISMSESLDDGKLEFILDGTQLKGRYVLVRMHNSPKNWLLIKERSRKKSV